MRDRKEMIKALAVIHMYYISLFYFEMYFNDLNTNFIFLDISVDTFMKYVYTCIRKIRIQYGAKFFEIYNHAFDFT